jgi:hypothetical protein
MELSFRIVQFAHFLDDIYDPQNGQCRVFTYHSGLTVVGRREIFFFGVEKITILAFAAQGRSTAQRNPMVSSSASVSCSDR